MFTRQPDHGSVRAHLTEVLHTMCGLCNDLGRYTEADGKALASEVFSATVAGAFGGLMMEAYASPSDFLDALPDDAAHQLITAIETLLSAAEQELYLNGGKSLGAGMLVELSYSSGRFSRQFASLPVHRYN